ncbi:hypothetical protein CMI37_08990 [Candidatus Pacearchaeota archaeon]|nr:hypothetical protein [Candidatus Pacearchaeota archaeon]|tara:strand:+ start:224 stop:940 length:717 start_codon:yes stop_codon:yes gene_type:complete
MVKILIPYDIVQIKDAIWAGEKQRAIAQNFGVTQTTISRIATGDEYFDTAWPDGSIGPLPINRRKEIHVGRRSRAAQAVLSVMEDAKVRPSEPILLEAIEQVEEETHTPEEQPLEVVQSEDPPRPRITREEADAMLEEQAEALEAEDQQAMLNAISDTGDNPEAEEQEEATEVDVDVHSWDVILKLAKTNAFVEKAERDDNTLLRNAICIVFKALPEDNWESSQCANLLKSTMEVLEA